MITNYKSYKYIKYKLNNGFFDKYIDMMYILTMENSNRTEQFINNIIKFKPHSQITIQINKGYKNINKQLYKQTSIYDLNDAYYHVFLHAKKKNYKNILIFEDDFFFDKLIDVNIVCDIGNFITNNNYHVYNIGSAFHFSIPYTITHHKSFFYFASHGAIYSELFINQYINDYNNIITCAYDEYWNKFNIIKYKYYKPICFQLFVETENRKSWPVANFTINLVKLLNMDNSHKPGFYIINYVSYIILFIFLIILIKKI